MNFLRILCLFLMIVLFSCREDFEQNIAIPQTFNPELLGDYKGEITLVDASVKGIVVDLQGSPIANAQVDLNDNQTSTDEYGHFFFTNVPMNAEGTVVNVTVEDFQLGSKLFYPRANATENLEITLNRIESDDELDGLVAGVLTISGGITFAYPENAFLNNDGSIYTGSVFVNSTFTNKSNDNFFKTVPGNFQAVDINNGLVGLKAAQLLEIMIVDENRNLLQINKEAPIKLSLTQEINEGMKAWYYSKDDGLYTVNTEIEDQIITYKNNTNILIAEAANTRGQALTLHDTDGTTPLENMNVKVLNNSQEVIYSGFSNDLGQIQFNSLSDEVAILQIIDACGQLVHNESILTNITDISLDQVATNQIAGEVYTCEVKPNTNNVIRVVQGTRVHYFYEEDSEFELTLQTCANGMAVVTALEDSNADLANLESLDLDDITSAIELFTCENPSINQLRLIDTETGDVYLYNINSTAGSNNLITTFAETDNIIDSRFQIEFQGSEMGNYSEDALSQLAFIRDPTGGLQIEGEFEEFEVTRFGDTERITLGNFTGTLTNDIDNENINFRGDFNFYFQE